MAVVDDRSDGRDVSDSSERSLGGRFWLMLFAFGFAGVGLCVILLAVFGWMWATWGLFGALIAFFAFVLAAAWAYGRRERHRRDLPA
jgi:hypothetical protein